MKKHLTVALTVLLVSISASAQVKPSETSKDWKMISKDITLSAAEEYYQAEMIYRWVCDNIEYDRNATIHTADEAYEKKKASSMGFCEVFYRIAEASGLKTQITIGESKEIDGSVNHDTHAWIIAETDRGLILIEPTWGAGLMLDGKFVKTPNNMAWFDVDPHVMVSTHFPARPKDQLLENPIDKEAFEKLPYIHACLEKYGLKGKESLKKGLDGSLRLPVIYGCLTNEMMVTAIPVAGTLKAGEKYLFEAVKNDSYDYVIRIDDIDIEPDQWIENSYSHRAEFTVAGNGKVMIYVIDKNTKNGEVAAAFEYAIDTEGVNLEEVAEHVDPYMSPELQGIKNLKVNIFKRLGIDGHELLEEIRETGSHAVPEIYTDINKMEIIDIPLHSPLKLGWEYTFEFLPNTDAEWVIDNSGTWHREWDKKAHKEGVMRMTVTVKNLGYLVLMVKIRNNEYVQVIKYAVTR